MPFKDSKKAPTDSASKKSNSIFVRVILALWLACSIFAFTLLFRIDFIVHHTLYDFGLQFSLSWADPYWIAFRLTYVLLAIPFALSVAVLGRDLWRWKSNNKKQTSKPRLEPPETQSISISCPSCKRVFSKPLVLLQYPNGKAEIVNACPYCNAIIKDVDQKEDHIETRVLETPEQET